MDTTARHLHVDGTQFGRRVAAQGSWMDSSQDSADGVVQDLSTEELRELYRSAPDGIVIVNEPGLIRHVNPQAETMFGYARGELAGRPIEVLVPEESRSAHQLNRVFRWR